MSPSEERARTLLETAIELLESGNTVERLKIAAEIRAFLRGTERMVK